VTYTFSVMRRLRQRWPRCEINDLPNTDLCRQCGCVNGPAPTVTNTAPNISWANLPLAPAPSPSRSGLTRRVGQPSLTTPLRSVGQHLVGPNERTYTDTAIAVVTPPAVDGKTSPRRLTGSGQHNPAIVDVNIGEAVTYHMTITMRKAPQLTPPTTCQM
jgi:hypothetical protein